MDIAEPTTTATDYLLAVASAGFSVSIARHIGPHNRLSAWYWFAAFLTSAVAAAAGGTFHGLAPYLAPAALHLLWSVTMFCIGACAALIAAAIRSTHVDERDGSRTWLIRGTVATAIGILVLSARVPQTTYFNYNDLYHLIQLAGLWCFFRCARAARDRKPWHQADG